jgi:hypothetical protein
VQSECFGFRMTYLRTDVHYNTAATVIFRIVKCSCTVVLCYNFVACDGTVYILALSSEM